MSARVTRRSADAQGGKSMATRCLGGKDSSPQDVKKRDLWPAGRVRGLLALTVILALLATGCSGFFVDPSLSSITITPSSPTVSVGDTLQLKATGTYSDSSTKTLGSSDVSWSSSDTSIATVSSGGLVTGVSSGSPTITAESGSISADVSVNVTLDNVTKITVSPSSASVSAGTYKQFDATATLSGGGTSDVTDTATWTSSDTTVATVGSSTGYVTTLVAGQTTITASYKSSGTTYSDSATLTVN